VCVSFTLVSDEMMNNPLQTQESMSGLQKTLKNPGYVWQCLFVLKPTDTRLMIELVKATNAYFRTCRPRTKKATPIHPPTALQTLLRKVQQALQTTNN